MTAESSWTLKRLWTTLRKLWWVVVATTVIGAGAMFTLASFETPVYRATASLFFALNQGTSASDLNQGSAYTQNQMLSFAQLATSSRVLTPVIEELNLDVTARELARSISISIPQSTVILEVTASSQGAERAADLANALAASLTEVVLEVAPLGPEGAPTISAQTIDDAVAPEVQSSPSKTRDAALGAIIGLLVGVAGVFLFSGLDTRVRSEEGLEEVADIPLLGSITRMPGGHDAGGLVVAREPMGHAAEEFRRVRSALTFASMNSKLKTLLVTSTSASEGKSMFAANLALTLADLQHRVLLIDADLRRPHVHEYLGIESAVGLTTVLMGQIEFDRGVFSRSDTTLDILPAGSPPPNPAEVLTSAAFRDLLAAASATYDFVVVDSPPVLSVADPNLLAPLVDGVIVIVDSTKTRRAGLAKSLRSLEAAGGRIVGVVLNKVREDRRRRSYYVEE